MRVITLIIIHCSAVRPWQQSGFHEIDTWHLQRGFKYGCGYHKIIRRDGTIEDGRPYEMIGAHCQHRNQHSIGIVYEGGLDANGKPADTRTEAQKHAMIALLRSLKVDYPDAEILGHRDLPWVKKKCPCFDARSEYKNLQPLKLEQ